MLRVLYNRKRFVALWRAVTASLSSGITVVYFSDIIIHVLCDVQMTRRVAPFYRAFSPVMRSTYNHILFPQSRKAHLKLAAPISRKLVTDQRIRMATIATYKVPKVENESNVRSLAPYICPYTQQSSALDRIF